MKRWDMIHKIKMLHDNGNGLSMRQIRDELGIYKNTVKKYLKMDEKAIYDHFSNREREKKVSYSNVGVSIFEMAYSEKG